MVDRRLIAARLILIGVVLIASLTTLFSAQAQDDCGSGLAQRLSIGDRGLVVPTPPNLRLRAAPAGDQIGELELNLTFTVIDGPQCVNDISWYQVEADDGQIGWVAEGVDGEYFIEPTGETVEVVSGGGALADDCSAAPEPRLRVGYYAEVLETTTFYDSYREAAGTFSAGTEVLVAEGPRCQGGRYQWRVIEGAMIGFSYQVLFETDSDRYVIEPAENTLPSRAAFNPERQFLRPEDSAPILDRNGQLFAAGGGGFGDLPCAILSSVIYYLEPAAGTSDCIAGDGQYTIGEQVTLSLYTPDGTLYEEYETAVANYVGVNTAGEVIEYLAIFPEAYPTEIGLPTGLWRMVIDEDNWGYSYIYELQGSRDGPSVAPICDVNVPTIALYEYEPFAEVTILLMDVQPTTDFVEGVQGVIEAELSERYRWNVQVDENGALFLNLTFIPNGIILTEDELLSATDGLASIFYGKFNVQCETATTTEDAEADPIAYGQLASVGLLADGSERYLAFNGSAGDTITMEFTAGSWIETYGIIPETGITLLAPDGSIVAEDDISDVTLPTSGTYYLRFTALTENPATYGTFLFGYFVKITGTNTPEGALTYGTDVEATLADSDQWTFEGTAGEVITISVESEAFDPVVELYAADGTLLASDDDSGAGLNATIAAFELPESDSYTITVRHFGSKAGDYSLIVVEE